MSFRFDLKGHRTGIGTFDSSSLSMLNFRLRYNLSKHTNHKPSLYQSRQESHRNHKF